MSVIQGFLCVLSQVRVPVWHQGSVGTEGTLVCMWGGKLLLQKYKLRFFFPQKSIPQTSIWK